MVIWVTVLMIRCLDWRLMTVFGITTWLCKFEQWLFSDRFDDSLSGLALDDCVRDYKLIADYNVHCPISVSAACSGIHGWWSRMWYPCMMIYDVVSIYDDLWHGIHVWWCMMWYPYMMIYDMASMYDDLGCDIHVWWSMMWYPCMMI